MKNLSRALLLSGMAAFIALGPSCGDGFGTVRGQRRLVVELQDREKISGERLKPLPLAVDTPIPFRVIIKAFKADGSLDTGFSGFVRLSAKPGAIEPLSGPDTEGRNVKLVQGESRAVDVRLANAYGTTYILADDLGYIPVDPLASPPPRCSNGVDDDGDGRVDYPADDGCAFANDDSEEGSSYAQGASTPIFFSLPRIADVRGLKCLGTPPVCSGAGATSYPKEQIQVDTGYHDRPDGPPQFDFDVVVSRISSDGFYSTDVNDPRGAGFTSIFAFNFNSPPRMRTCDRLKTLGGTANEFFGFTQVAFPTWTLEEWDPRLRPCLVPDAEQIKPAEGSDNNLLLRKSGGIVYAITSPAKEPGKDETRDFRVFVTPKFGPGNTPKAAAGYAPGPDATNCDFNKDGRIDFALGAEEGVCANACDADPECTEYSNFLARRTFRLTLVDATGAKSAVQADASTSASFDALALKGKLIRYFGGTLHYFSGGSQFTIEARCSDDIVESLEGNPLGADRVCANDDDCKIYGGDYACRELAQGARACRTASKNTDNPNKCEPESTGCAPPPLSCVFPRTFLETNPQ